PQAHDLLRKMRVYTTPAPIINRGSILCLERLERMSDDTSGRYEARPWGSFTILDEGDGYKVKRIEVLPGKRLSYQKHARRSEHWMVVRGIATVTLDGRDETVQSGGVIDVPVGAAHRVMNPGA